MLNGVLFVVDPPDLAGFDQRESIYDRVEIAGELGAGADRERAGVRVCRQVGVSDGGRAVAGDCGSEGRRISKSWRTGLRRTGRSFGRSMRCRRIRCRSGC